MITIRPRYLDTWITFTEVPCTDQCLQAWSAYLRTPCPTQHAILGKPTYSFLLRSRYLDTGYELIVPSPVVMVCVPVAASFIQFFGAVYFSTTPIHISVNTIDEYLTPDHAFYLFFFPLSTKTSVPVTIH